MGCNSKISKENFQLQPLVMTGQLTPARNKALLRPVFLGWGTFGGGRLTKHNLSHKLLGAFHYSFHSSSAFHQKVAVIAISYWAVPGT